MAEWSKALVLGTSHFGGAGSNPVPVIISRLVEVKLMLAIESKNRYYNLFKPGRR